MSESSGVEGEEWRPIPGAEGWYSVSNLGRVRSEPTPRPTSGKQRGRILQPSRDTKGYRIFRLCVPDHRPKPMKVHRAVARAFLGPAPSGMQINHKNGDKDDNRVENLEYVSCRENIRHCWDTGLHGIEHCRGEASNQAKLTEDAVRFIRGAGQQISCGQLAAMFGVSPQTIWLVANRRTWKHV